jgi:AraC-like DNA-binding protein
MTFLRSAVPSGLIHDVHEPSLCVVAQGSKRVMLGDEVYDYGGGCYLVATVDLPVCAEILDATADAPYLCLKLGFDMNEVADMLLAVGESALGNAPPARGLFMSRANAPLVDAVLRLARLLQAPEDIAALAPLAEREIIYRLLKSDEGRRLSRAVSANGHARRIARAVAWLKAHYAEPLRIETLASHAGMSASSLHEHFKAVTAMTPVQYQKQLRLQEARRLLMSDGVDAATAGHRVGYESPSQFSREYSRLFGAPPARDAQRLRGLSLV